MSTDRPPEVGKPDSGETGSQSLSRPPSAGMYEKILEAAADAIVTVNEAQEIVHFNRGAEQMFGYSKPEVLGRSLSILLPEQFRASHAEHVRAFGESSETARLMGHRREVFGVRKDGTPFPAEASILKLDAPDGRRLYTALVRDVTDRKRMDEHQRFLAAVSGALTDTLDFEATLESVVRLPVPILADGCVLEVSDDSGRTTSVSHGERAAPVIRVLTLMARGQQVGLLKLMRAAMPRAQDGSDALIAENFAARAALAIDNARLYHDAQRATRTATNLTLLMREQAVEIEQQMEEARVTSDQLEKSNEELMATGLVLEERTDEAVQAHERAASALAMARSATVKAEVAQAAAEAANQAKEMFLTTMSHELRTPLNAISGHVQLIEMGILGPVTPKQHAALDRVMLAQHHLLGLINDVLNFAKLGSGTVVYDIQPVVVAEVMADAASMMEQQMQSKGLTLVVKLPDNAIVTLADRDKLLQILINLLSNAMKFTPAGGQVLIETTARADGAEAVDVIYIRVTDSGIGIAMDKLTAVFEPFVQVSATNISRREGTGLGLSISRDLARGMGGDLRARSMPGEGSSFTVSLPAARSDSRDVRERRTHEERRESEQRSGENRRHEDL